jgi:hypothetical protein
MKSIEIPHALLGSTIGYIMDKWTREHGGTLEPEDLISSDEFEKYRGFAIWHQTLIPLRLSLAHILRHPEIPLERYNESEADWDQVEIRNVVKQFYDYLQAKEPSTLDSAEIGIELKEIDFAEWRSNELPKILDEFSK